MKSVITILCLIVISSTTLMAQIPNGGFESWTNASGYNAPVGWDNMNAMTTSMGSYTCLKGTPGDPGSSYIKLVSTTVSGMGVVPGIATCGMLDMTNMNAPEAMSGFAFNQRPQSIAGNWQYMASGSDMGYLSVLLTKWNMTMMMRDTVAYLTLFTRNMQMSWTSFSNDLNYMSQETPDTAFITLSSSSATPVAGSYLYVDTLHFAGSVSTGIIEKNNSLVGVSVFPNPSTDILNVSFTNVKSGSYKVQLISLTGSVIKELSAVEVTGSTWNCTSSFWSPIASDVPQFVPS